MKDFSWEWTEDMGEISGFGGGYEESCKRYMRIALAYFCAFPDEFKRFLQEEKTDDEKKALNKLEYQIGSVMDNGWDSGASGAQIMAAFSHAARVYRFGWESYKKEMRERRIRNE